MADAPAAAREGWSGRTGFVLATIGSAVGIGSIWKFPYEVGANGGGAFVLLYGVGLALVVMPLLLVEFGIGRRGGGDAVTSFAAVAASHGRSRNWRFVGVLGALTAFAILSFYAVIGGWTLAHAAQAVMHPLPTTPQAAQDDFDRFLAAPGRMLVAHALFLVVIAAVVLRGVQRGIEMAMKVLMPVLVVLLCGLAVYASVEGDAAGAVRYLFVPDLSSLTGRAALEALGLGFFSIGVGLGVMTTYAALTPAGIDLRQAAVVSVVADSAISLVAGMAVFPVVFARGLDPAGGPGLVFVTLPLGMSSMPGGRIAALALFVLLFVAALGSAVSLLEAVVAAVGRRHGLSRPVVVGVSTATCFVAGVATVLSFNRWSGWHPLGATSRYEAATVYDLIDELTSNVMLPVGALAMAVLAGWVLPARLVPDAVGLGDLGGRLLRVLCRWAVPVVVVVVAVVSLAT